MEMTPRGDRRVVLEIVTGAFKGLSVITGLIPTDAKPPEFLRNVRMGDHNSHASLIKADFRSVTYREVFKR